MMTNVNGYFFFAMQFYFASKLSFGSRGECTQILASQYEVQMWNHLSIMLQCVGKNGKDTKGGKKEKRRFPLIKGDPLVFFHKKRGLKVLITCWKVMLCDCTWPRNVLLIFFPSIFLHPLYFSVQYKSKGKKLKCGKFFELRYGYSFLIKHTLSLYFNFELLVFFFLFCGVVIFPEKKIIFFHL